MDASQQFVVDAHGAVLNNDEQAWKAYKAQRDQAIALARLQKQITALTLRVLELEKKVNEATTDR